MHTARFNGHLYGGGVCPGMMSVCAGLSARGWVSAQGCLPGGGVCPEGVCRGARGNTPHGPRGRHTHPGPLHTGIHTPLPTACWDIPPPLLTILDTRLWKHYLPATTVADGNYRPYVCYFTSLCHEWFKVLFSSNNWIGYSVLHGWTSLQLRTFVKYMLFFSILMVFTRCISLFKLVLFLHSNAFIRIHLCRSTKLYIFLSFLSMTSPIKTSDQSSFTR